MKKKYLFGLLIILGLSTLILYAFETNRTGWFYNPTIQEALDNKDNNNTTHPYLTDQAIKYAYDRYSVSLTPDQKRWLIQGSIEEDYGLIGTGSETAGYGFVSPNCPIDNYVWAKANGTYEHTFFAVESATGYRLLSRRAENHFLPSINGQLFISSDATGADTWASNSTKNNRNWTTALSPTASAEIKWKSLGHCLHLIEDMAVPSHTRKDIHALIDVQNIVDNLSPHSDKDDFEVWAGQICDPSLAQRLWRWTQVQFTVPILTEIDNLSDLPSAISYLRNHTAKNYVSQDTVFKEEKTDPPILKVTIYFSTSHDEYLYNSLRTKILKKGVLFKSTKYDDKTTDAKRLIPLTDDEVLSYYGIGQTPGVAMNNSECHLALWHDTAAKSVAVAAKVIKLYYDLLPAQVSSPNPTDKATNIPITQELSWAPASGATSYDVYLGTTSPGTFKGNQAGTSYNPSALSYSTPYYWRIDSKNDTGTTPGVVWSFTTASAPDTTSPTVSSVSPPNKSTNVPVSNNISVTFSKAMNQSTTQSAFSISPNVAGTFSWSGNTMTFNPASNLAYNTTYTCVVSAAAKDLAGNNLSSQYQWNFTTQVGLPDVTTDAATNITANSARLNGTLNATGGTTCSDWFQWGPTSSLGNVTPPQSRITTGAFYADLTGLSGSTPYYYRAVASNSAGTDYGSILSFTTLPPTGNISVTVRGLSTHPGPWPTTIKVIRYTTSWSVLNTIYADTNWVATFNTIPAGQYYFEAYQLGPFGVYEYWGTGLYTVYADMSTPYTLNRYIPYVSQLTVYDNKTGAEVSGTSVPLGTTLRYQIAVVNPSGNPTYNCKGKIYVNTSRTYNYSSPNYTTGVGSVSGGTQFTFTNWLYTPTTAGTYYHAGAAETYVNTAYTCTDSQEFTTASYGWVTVAVPPPTTIFSENFEGTWPASWWYCGSEVAGKPYWGDNTKRAYGGSWSGYCADENNGGASTYQNGMQTWMDRRNVNLVGFGSATLSFKLWYNIESNYDFFTIFIRDQSGNWHNMKHPSHANVLPTYSTPYGWTGNSGGWI
ncbi:MAG: Ig-like domain-containing protein, partial [Planctomycetes bacterium]|nr:Ig-like domain-containing protein [Planctomycetota bacterium]